MPSSIESWRKPVVLENTSTRKRAFGSSAAEHRHRDGLGALGLAVGHRDLGLVDAWRGVGVRRILDRRVRRAVAVEVPAVGQRVAVGVRRRDAEGDLQRREAAVGLAVAGLDHRRRVLGRRLLAAELAVDLEVVERRRCRPGLFTPSVKSPKRGVDLRVRHGLRERGPGRAVEGVLARCTSRPSWSGAARCRSCPTGTSACGCGCCIASPTSERSSMRLIRVCPSSEIASNFT